MPYLLYILLIIGLLLFSAGVLFGTTFLTILAFFCFTGAGVLVFYQIKHLKQRSKALFESNADGMLEIERSGRIIRANERAVEIFGYQHHELVEMNVDELVPEALRAKHAEHRQEYFNNPKPRFMGNRDVKLFASRKNQETFPVEIGLTFVKSGREETVIAGIRDITHRVTIEKQARVDHLTGLRNRLTCEKLLDREIQRNKRYGYSFSVILCDIDHFKEVNDTFGHSVGDHVLIGFAKILNSTVRELDVNGRWGGEEFLVICPNSDAQHASYLAERVRKAVAASDFSPVEQLTCSFGVATFTASDTMSTLLERADKALYEAKENGRNQVASDYIANSKSSVEHTES